MRSVFTYDAYDSEALVSYVGEIFEDWVAWSDRSGGLIWDIKVCLYCSGALRFAVRKQKVNSSSGDPKTLGEDPYEFTLLILCTRCGWYRHQTYLFLVSPIFPIAYGATALFTKNQLTSSDLPITELRRHLMRNWADRRLITPGQAEALVADIFRSVLDAEVVYSSNGVYAPDGGIDFVLVQSSTGIEYAFQVKRRLTDRPECVEEVRAFLGAVALSKFSHAYYVTTSPRFTSTAKREIESGSEQLANRGLRLDLVDGKRLYTFLREGLAFPKASTDLTQRFEEDDAPWFECPSLDRYDDFFQLWEPPNSSEAKECGLLDLLNECPTEITRDAFE